MKSALVISFDPSRVAAPARARLVRAGRESLEKLTGHELSVDKAFGDTHLLVSSVDRADLSAHEGSTAVLLSRTCRTDDGELLDGNALLVRLGRARDTTLLGISPPFAFIFRHGHDETWWAATDMCGVHHVYWHQDEGWAAVSSSSLSLARICGSNLDMDAIGIYTQVGNYLGNDTPYKGVRKLGAGVLAALHRGTFTTQCYLRDEEYDTVLLDREQAIRAGETAITVAVKACLDAHPQPWIELSGGLDSRAVLAAVPKAQRSQLTALTLGQPDSADLKIATTIARQWRLAHKVVDTSRLLNVTAREARSLATAASRRRDFSGSAVDLAVLDWVEAQVEQQARLGGVNGELARGFYYPGQRARAQATDELVSSLARWRLLTNAAVDRALLADDFAASSHASTIAVLQRAFKSYGRDWLSSTDEFYLRERMSRWAGIDLSASGQSRSVLAPFFDRRYISWARRVPPEHKRGSRLFCAVLARLDSELAAMPLDSGGRSPAQIARPRPIDRVKAGYVFASKAVRKANQRMRRRNKAPTTSATLADLIIRDWSDRRDSLALLETVEFLNYETVRAVAAGNHTTSRASVSFLVNLHGMLSFLGDVDDQL